MKKVNIDSVCCIKSLIAMEVGKDISVSNAHELVKKFEGNTFIDAYITDKGALYIEARYPKVTIKNQSIDDEKDKFTLVYLLETL